MGEWLDILKCTAFTAFGKAHAYSMLHRIFVPDLKFGPAKSTHMSTVALDGGIFISDKARDRVAALLAEEGKGDDFFVRVSVVSGGCSGLSYKMEFDNRSRPTDQVFHDKGMKLVTDMKSVLYLFNTTLDYSDGLDGKGFHFLNPNASRTCACGESFSV